MSERRWIEERRWEVDGIWRVAAGSRTDAEVLAEMGGQKAWFCNAYDTVHWTGTCRHTLDGCGWVWIVKEDDDE